MFSLFFVSNYEISIFQDYGPITKHLLTVVCTEWDANKSFIIIWSWEKDEKNAVWFLFLHTIMFYNDYSTSFQIREYCSVAKDELFDNTYQFEKCNNKSDNPNMSLNIKVNLIDAR